MADFLIQNDTSILELEEQILEQILKKNSIIHTVKYSKLSENIDNKGMIPVGTIEFVTKYLRNTENFDREIPVEIPKYLQTEEFLKREYNIVTWNKIPRTGKFFLKDVTKLKNFGEIVDAKYYDIDDIFSINNTDNTDYSLKLSRDSYYQVSSILPIKSEYRVYVICNEIVAIANYNGDTLIFPDTKLLQKAVLLIQYNEKYLQSYTIDVAVGNFGTAILEIHNFTSVGLYTTLFGDNLATAYIDGIRYLLNDNSVKYL